MGETDWNAVSFVTRGQYRAATLEHLDTVGPSTPSDIATATGFDIAHVSRALSNLREREYVDLLVDEDTKKGRYYGVTEKGSRTASATKDL